jgi:glycosyltransferase involved in cell wall biosynthesis
MKKILLVTDAWHPQVNGVVTTLTNLANQAKKSGDKIYVYHPGRATIRFPLPMYPEITIGIPNPLHVRKLLKKQKWDHIHIATPEAPLGISFTTMCKVLNLNYSISCHTKFPEFVSAKYPWISVNLGWKYMKWCYKGCEKIITTTDSMVDELKRRGFTHEIYPWSRGVDRSIFYPENKTEGAPILLCVSRVSEEKGLDDFCSLQIPNTTKILVGDGPYLNKLKEKYTDVEFVGKKQDKELGDYYRSASVFVFPSKSDTFGVVNIEALACGTPVAAYPVTGPKDIIENGVNGILDENLETAVLQALELDRNVVYESSLIWTWETSYKQFKDILLSIL